MNRRSAPPPPVLTAPLPPLPECDALVCSYCGDVSAFEARLPAEAFAEALSGGFVVHGHRLVLFGRCTACRGAARVRPEVRS